MIADTPDQRRTARKESAMLQTEFSFHLPLGFVDAEGNLHREGTMRLATAYDEIAPLKDPRVQANPGYLLVILLARVITRLGTLEQLNPKVIEGLYAGDLAYLQDLYQRVNEHGTDRVVTQCPHCDKAFSVEVRNAGGSGATP
jgi:hypothetical protein